jgi:hypothetical protein
LSNEGKTNDLYEIFKKGVIEKRGRRKRNPCPMRLCNMNPNLSQLSSTTSTSSMTSDTKISSLVYGNTSFTEELLILTILSLVRKDKEMIPDYK